MAAGFEADILVPKTLPWCFSPDGQRRSCLQQRHSAEVKIDHKKVGWGGNVRTGSELSEENAGEIVLPVKAKQ